MWLWIQTLARLSLPQKDVSDTKMALSAVHEKRAPTILSGEVWRATFHPTGGRRVDNLQCNGWA